ncbi:MULTISPECIES: hypothetical protein [unclassified Aureispira]|uniref:hypothetical protein n=1 Tax=unclassified Aureispira TaxID=2649989 RepID=UPI000695BB25|nr:MULTISPECIES: hypothetical protein [unclassified Aureispira]WMX12547.1 hypothetical protein QP953_17090 [Aureispira sp. CCB-E]
MSNSNDSRHFVTLFLLFIGIEVLLYTLIVYLDLFGLKLEFAKRDPAFMVFYGISAIVFFFFISKVDRKR